MKAASAWSLSADTTEAVRSAYAELERELGGRPDWLAVHGSFNHDGPALMDALGELGPGVAVHGGTSCLGIMTETGFHSDDGVGLGLFGLQDPAGRYGVGAVESGSDPRAAGAAAARQALAAAGRADESPALIWLTSAPGYEEDILSGVESVVGAYVPIAGGSAADNTIEGHWRQFANGRVYSDGVVVTAMYPSTAVHYAFRSGYYPTKHQGTVTRAQKRTIYTIDGRPAAQVYNEWTGGVIEDHLGGGNVLGVTTLHPIGRVVRRIGDVAFYRLSHPETVTREGGLTLFADFESGEEIVLMMGSRASLVTRAGVVAQSALDRGAVSHKQIAGGLVIYCAGCMLTVQDQMDDVAASVGEALGGNPFLGVFTFGEQGCFVGGGNRHGNLMISTVAFERD